MTDNRVSVLLGTVVGGAGTLHPGVGAAPTAVTSGDFDGDGDRDLALLNSTDSNISIPLNN